MMSPILSAFPKDHVQNGARRFALEYDESGRIKGIFFKIRLNDKELPFRLPAKPDNVYAALFAGMQYEDRLRQERMKKAEAIAYESVSPGLRHRLP